MTLAELRNEYRPYDTMPAFDEGFDQYKFAGLVGCAIRNPYTWSFEE